MTRGKVLALVGAVVLLTLAVLWWQLGEAHYGRMLLERPSSGSCERKLTRSLLQRSLLLERDFLLTHQRPEGNFDYEYDFERRLLSNDDNEVRQAGALWGLTLLYAHEPSEQLRAAVERGLDFFHQRSRRSKGSRCIDYAGTPQGSTGTVALVALAHIDYLRAQPAAEPSDLARAYRDRLGQYLKFLVKSLRPDGLWHAQYQTKSCKPQGGRSPYADGEALLALVKAAKYLGYTELLPSIAQAAGAGRASNIDAALERDPDSDITKGYYQWSSMAFYELATSDFPGMSSYGETVLRLADWMIDEHDVLWRLRNTGYAYEGIIHAYVLAKHRGEQARVDKYGCVIDVGLDRLLTWQVGGPLGSSFAQQAKDDPQALGGVQNGARDVTLRIDVTQHQAHATLLALRYVYTGR